jgi:polyisoprenoid-binding protein YceI
MEDYSMAYQIDLAHSQVQFTVRHMMISKVRGWFTQFDGTFAMDENNPENSRVEVRIDVDSINTRDEKRDGHLRSADFFDVENHPQMIFRSTRVEVLGGERARMHGDLTIRGITRPVVLDVEYVGMAKSPFGTTNYGFNASTTINRKDWDLTWNVALETGGVLVSDTLKITLDVQTIRRDG